MAFIIQSLSTSTCSMIPLLQQRRFVIAAIKIETSTVHRRKPSRLSSAANRRPALLLTAAAAAAAAVALSMMAANAIEFGTAETLSNIPQTLSGECNSGEKQDCNKKPRIQRPKSRKAESCTIKCVTTCIRGGNGSPGEGPLNVRKPLVVFKQGFRSRQYCLTECSDICNLIRDGDDGP